MSDMEEIESHKCFGGVQGVYRHKSVSTGTDMTFALFFPGREGAEPLPVLTYLSGLTCTHANVMEKGNVQRAAAKHGVMVVMPDTSPRDTGIAGEADDWQLGVGAGFYVDAVAEPWARHWRMYSYIASELPAVIAAEFPGSAQRQGIFGHSMGGHGALVMALRNPGSYRSCSAFAPIVNPIGSPWARRAFESYLGDFEKDWRAYDACALVEDGHRFGEILIDQGLDDQFLDEGLKPWLFEQACAETDIKLTLRMQEGYDHSYYFISTFMEDHIAWHAQRLKSIRI